jgi:outer membrane lipoprotein-sorting protein
MNKFLRTGFIALGLVLFLHVFAAINANAQGPLKPILDRMDQYNKALSSFQSNVTMVKWDSTLNANDTSEGMARYIPKTAKRPMAVRVDWTKPAVEQMSVIGDQYELYRPRLNQVIKGKVSKTKSSGVAGGALSFMSMSKAELQANYTVRYLGQEAISNGTQTWHLELTPKNPTSYKSAELWVNGDGLPLQAKVVEKNSDTTTVLLQNVQTNVTIKTDIFKLDYPKNAKIVNG